MDFKDNQSDFDGRFKDVQNYDDNQNRGSSYYKKGVQNNLSGGRQDRNDTLMSNFVNNQAFDNMSEDGGSGYQKNNNHRDSTFVNNNAFDDVEDDEDLRQSRGQ